MTQKRPIGLKHRLALLENSLQKAQLKEKERVAKIRKRFKMNLSSQDKYLLKRIEESGK